LQKRLREDGRKQRRRGDAKRKRNARRGKNPLELL
jgi:hypothetical protein